MFGFTEPMLGLLGRSTAETLVMVGVSTTLACLLGLVVGVLLVVTERGQVLAAPALRAVLAPIVDVTRSVPFIILLVAIIPFTRLVVGTSIGTAAAIVPLVVAAAPYVARLVEAALKEVDGGVVDAVRAMGAGPWQLIRKVYLREAVPPLVRAATLTAINLVGFSAMAGFVGGGGLGDVAIRYGYQRFQPDVMFATVVIMVILVQGIQGLGEFLARRFDHR